MRRPMVAMFVLMALIAAACGGGGDDSEETSAEATAEATAEGTPEETPTEDSSTDAVTDITGVEPGVIKIVAEGTFVDPYEGTQTNSAGVGSGFFISEDGLAVTNNHVVAGAALLDVYVAGSTEPVNAQILGVSECSDLAVIQVEGDGFVALGTRTDEVVAGLDVVAAGYPLTGTADVDDVDYTLTSGIVSSTETKGETEWASVDSVLEHDARIRGGNSGGPLVDESGQVVGVNYAGRDDTDQNFAIAAAEAQPIIDELAAGNDVDSIGINGEAIVDPEAGISGIWVASVSSGSPADAAGIEPGDLITSLENLLLATDGSMADYCDILRTQGSDATMAVEVIRSDTEEVLEGQINGDPLVVSFSFAQEFDEEVDSSAASDGTIDTYENYVDATDDSGILSVSIPEEWADLDGAENPGFGPSLWASSDLAAFNEFTAPGIIFEAGLGLTVDDVPAVLESLDYSEVCTYASSEEYEDAFYFGNLDLWTDCGGTGAIVVSLAAVPLEVPPTGDYVLRMVVVAFEQRDLDAADIALATFFVNP